MPMLGTRGGGSVRGFGRFGKILLLSIIDSFDRSGAIAGSSTSDSKGIWKNIVSGFSTNGSYATSSTNGSISVVDLEGNNITNAKVDIPNGDGGVGLSFWGQDSSNFYSTWATYNSSTSSSYVCGTGQSNTPTPCGQRFSLEYRIVYCCDGNTYRGGPCPFDPNSGCSDRFGSNNCGSNFDGYGGQCYNSETVTVTTTYTSTFNLGQNNSVISSETYSSSSGGYSRGYSIVATTSGNNITVQLYSGYNGGGSLLSTRTSSPGSPVKGFGVGVYRTSSPQLQGTSLDNLSATVTA